ncbi:MAG: T9SS type A sorting domain-containing protein [bacterium]
MKKILFTLLISLLSLNARSQIDSITYGISSQNSSPGLYLSKINVQTGNVSNVSLNIANFSASGFGRTVDPNRKIFYYISDSLLLCFNLNSGELIKSTTIINYPGFTFNGITYNGWDTTLYGIDVDATGQLVKLAKVNPNSGLVTVISPISVASSYSGLTGTTLDPFQGIFYFETSNNPSNHLIGVSIYSGIIVSDVAIGIATGNRFGPISFNCHDSTLYGLMGNLIEGRKLAKINTLTGSVTIISQSIVAYSILNEPSTIDPFQKNYYFEDSDHKYKGVNIYTGNLDTDPVITPYPNTFFTGFIFNSTCYSDLPTLIEENVLNVHVEICPNPAYNLIKVKSSFPFSHLEILNITGKKTSSLNFKSTNIIEIDITNYKPGVYIIVFQNANSSIAKKFIKIVTETSLNSTESN